MAFDLTDIFNLRYSWIATLCPAEETQDFASSSDELSQLTCSIMTRLQ